jgi:predicted nucleic acid-binding protein
MAAYAAGARLTSSELLIAEVPRSVRRIVTEDSEVDLDEALEKVARLFGAISLERIDRIVLREAGAVVAPHLGALDAIHVATAVRLRHLDAFVSYDQRQAEAARRAGLRVASPGT